ncbi:MAG: DUF3848 domain-containing protein [Oscillibacter sp.]|nr:DUF3848 domain-containing protein [Oscillibacter sp.]
MTKEELNHALYRRLKQELEQFRDSFLALPQDELLNRAHEYVVRQDIVSVMEYADLDERDAQALLNSNYPLDDVFQEFERRDIGYTQVLENCAAVCARNAEKMYQQKREAYAHDRPMATGEITAEGESAGKEHRKPKSLPKRKKQER